MIQFWHAYDDDIAPDTYAGMAGLHRNGTQNRASNSQMEKAYECNRSDAVHGPAGNDLIKQLG